MARGTSTQQRVDEHGDDIEAVMAASRALVAVASRSMAPVDDVVPLPQWRAMVVIGGADGISLNDVASALGVHASTATRLCDRLVASGMLRREPHPDDRRYLALSLTRKGHRLVDKVMAARREEIQEILGRLDPARCRRVVTAFRDFSDAAGETYPDF